VRKSLARIGFTYTRKSKSHYLVEEMVEAGFSCFKSRRHNRFGAQLVGAKKTGLFFAFRRKFLCLFARR